MKNPTPLRQKFIEYLTLHRKAERTVHSYVSFLYALASFHHRSPESTDRKDLQRWLYHLIAERKLAASTVNIAINALRAFYGGMLRRDIESLLANIKRPKRPTPVLRPYSMAEMERLLTTGVRGNLRARALLMTVWRTPPRRAIARNFAKSSRFLGLGERGFLIGPGGAPFGSTGFLNNCPIRFSACCNRR
jgi:site-specific recombinase XerD